MSTGAYRPMTPSEVKLARALSGCSFAVASFDKRFARNLGARASAEGPVITEKQAALLRFKVAAYRRQIRPSDLEPADRVLLTDAEAKRLREARR